MINLNAHQNAEQLVSRLTKEAALNASSHLLRLSLLTDGFTRTTYDFNGVERDFLVSVVYSMNETVALLNSLGAGVLVDALSLNNPEAIEWYNNAIKTLHKTNTEDQALAGLLQSFADRWERVRPSPKPTPEQLARQKAIDDAFKDDDGEETGLQDLAGLNGEDKAA